MAVLPVVLVWSDWPETAPKKVVMEGQPAMPTIRVAIALHLSSEVREVAQSSAATAPRKTQKLKGMTSSKGRGKFLEHGFSFGDVDLEAGEAAGATAGGGVTLDDLGRRGPRVEGGGVDVARALCGAAMPGQVVLTTAAWSHMQGRAPAGAYPLSLGTHFVTKAGVRGGATGCE